MSIDEVWRPVLLAPNHYEVSNLGRVRSKDRLPTRRKGRVLATADRGRGYQVVSLSVDGVTTNKNVHILVAQAFLDRPVHANQVNHKDGDKTNNALENLEWVSASENRYHATEVLGVLIGESHGMSKLREDDVRLIRKMIAQGKSCEDVSKEFPVGVTQIKRIKHRQSWRHLEDSSIV